MTEIMFQAFKWDATRNGRIGDWWEYLEKDILPELIAAKVTHIWLPPASKNREQEWVGYNKMDLYDLGKYRQWIQVWDDQQKKLVWMQHSAPSSLDLDATGKEISQAHRGTETLWGHQTELESLIGASHAAQMSVLADIVVNHRAPQQVNAHDEWISWGSDDHVIGSGKMVWGYKGKDDDPEQISYHSGGTGEDDGEREFGANIAHHSAKARAEIKEWLAWLRNEIKFDGFRWDNVKGFGPEHVAEYNYHAGSPFSVGEYRDGSTQRIYDWIDGSEPNHVEKRSLAFDFPLQTLLRDVFWGVRPFRDLGLWKYSSVSIAGGWPEKAVTFAENHDTAREPYKNDFPTDRKRLMQAHVFLLTHPGVPCIFFSHFVEKGLMKDIGKLCLLRHTQKITRRSIVRVLRSAEFCYAAEVDGRTIVKIGDEFWNPGDSSYALKLFGEGWAVWTR